MKYSIKKKALWLAAGGGAAATQFLSTSLCHLTLAWDNSSLCDLSYKPVIIWIRVRD
jgi:hypothetical protein